ncbi:MAG TPA: amidohydrolase family protein, partial [Ilumatobacteraceae bacterium]|nr:amidohydrolase family protein [Ilumatobacteraceae bacterium]
MVRGNSLFDGTRVVEVATVTIDGGKIVAVGQDRPPPGAEVIELGAAALMPGLVDCHQHLCFETLGEDAADADPAALADRARRSARRALAAGVTTIRDLGDKGYASLPLRHEHGLPTLLCAGPPITVPQGHCWYLDGEVDPSDGESGLRAAVRERFERGCDVVKIMMTGGFLTPTNPMWMSQFSLDDLRIVVDEAHRHRLPVAAHCHGIDGIERALRARVDSIEHCTFLDENLDVNATVELLGLIAESSIPVSLTIGRLPSYPVPALVEKNLERTRSTRRRLHELGAVLVPGTDAGIGDAKPHDVLPYALADLVAFGLTPAQGLRAMTREAAGA